MDDCSASGLSFPLFCKARSKISHCSAFLSCLPFSLNVLDHWLLKTIFSFGLHISTHICVYGVYIGVYSDPVMCVYVCICMHVCCVCVCVCCVLCVYMCAVCVMCVEFVCMSCVVCVWCMCICVVFML